VLVDLDRLEANIGEMSQVAAGAGVELRPHVKIHQCPAIAKMQIQTGALGVEVGTVDQAEVMAEAGIDDLMIAHPFYGERKLEKLRRLLGKPGLTLGIVIDMIEQARDISELAQGAGVTVSVHIKIDTGVNRYGVLPGEPVLYLARELRRLQGIDLAGIYAHESGPVPTDEGVAEMALEIGSIMTETAGILRREGFPIKTVAVGASPTFRATCRYLRDGRLSGISEIHPGGCVIGDMFYVNSYGTTKENCALTVLTGVVSTSHPDHVVVDAGLKTFGGDSLIGRRGEPDYYWNNMPSFGSVQGRPGLWLGRLGAESGLAYYMNPDPDSRAGLRLGERIEVVPNNATVVINLHDRMYGVRSGEIEREFSVAGRGS
jgi:D-serine deaminase-like pyridoxal phosphate-dependent protein